jgi:hypothetical protein
LASRNVAWFLFLCPFAIRCLIFLRPCISARFSTMLFARCRRP